MVEFHVLRKLFGRNFREQANLQDSLLADLEDLSDNDNENLDEDNGDAEHMEEDINRDLADIEVLNYDDLDSVSILIGSTTSLAGGAGT
ncbi:hypothetical protein L6452_12327 [Arctium lappa]|uniref:Uncharacterized protein n=1 Tax=Arctium lappa TaxID=4217 RepID=A0ACB9DRG8_ARCLA|nr:hypothetical protein L6452_12327 [Arctium lappa]